MNCAQCGDPLPVRTGPGRPAIYCGPPCARAAERVRLARRVLLGRLVEIRTANQEDRDR